MDIINTNLFRLSIRPYSRDFGERFFDIHCGTYRSGDHGKPRLEQNYYVHAAGLVAHFKIRPDGK